MKITRIFLALVLALSPLYASAQVAMPVVKSNGNNAVATGVVAVDSTGADATDTTNHAHRVNCVAGCLGSVPTGTAGTPNANVLTVQGVSGGTPTPITRPIDAAATSTPLTGTISDTSAHVLGPFTPQLARDIWTTIIGNGSAVGTAQLLRSTDGGTTKNGLTAGGSTWASWSIAAATPVVVNEQIVTASDASATFYLSITLSAGSVTYRVSQ